jgi:hypothetical protein
MIKKILEMEEGTLLSFPPSVKPGTHSLCLRIEENKFFNLSSGRVLIPEEGTEGQVLPKPVELVIGSSVLKHGCRGE